MTRLAMWLVGLCRAWSSTTVSTTRRHKDSEPLVRLGQGDYEVFIYGEKSDGSH